MNDGLYVMKHTDSQDINSLGHKTQNLFESISLKADELSF